LFKKILLIAVLVLAAVAGVIAWKIGPRNVIGMLRDDQRKEGNLKVGDRAPDVSLVSLDGRTPVRLSAHVGARPLILVFGSYT
jgi:ferric-dicitrate binding protein FerR (iron transport regulator)